MTNIPPLPFRAPMPTPDMDAFEVGETTLLGARSVFDQFEARDEAGTKDAEAVSEELRTICHLLVLSMIITHWGKGQMSDETMIAKLRHEIAFGHEVRYLDCPADYAAEGVQE